MDRNTSSLRVTAVRFLVLFAAAFITWCAALLTAHGAVGHTGLALALGLALSDVLACLGVIAAGRLDQAYAARCRRRVLTTPQEFPAIPLPDYLLAQIPPLYEAEITAEHPAHGADRWLPMPSPAGLQPAA